MQQYLGELPSKRTAFELFFKRSVKGVSNILIDIGKWYLYKHQKNRHILLEIPLYNERLKLNLMLDFLSGLRAL